MLPRPERGAGDRYALPFSRMAVVARVSVTLPKTRGALGTMAAISLLLAGSAAKCEPSPPPNPKPPPAVAKKKSGPADAPAAKPREAGAAGAAAGAPAVDPALVKRRREAIAQMLEANSAYRGWPDDGASKLVNAKFAGPFVANVGGLFTPRMETVYCAAATMVYGPFSNERTAVILIRPAPNGQERIWARVGLNYTPKECVVAKYGPFPEMELARQKRRQALGKKD